MSCRICGRWACCESFHPIEAQETWDELHGKDEYVLISEVFSLKQDILNLRQEIKEKNEEIERFKSEIIDLENEINSPNK